MCMQGSIDALCDLYNGGGTNCMHDEPKIWKYMYEILHCSCSGHNSCNFKSACIEPFKDSTVYHNMLSNDLCFIFHEIAIRGCIHVHV